MILATARAYECEGWPWPYTAIDWDFDLGSHGFTPTSCAGASVWEWGFETQQTTLSGALPQRAWSTILNGNYPDNAGQGLLSPSFRVTPSSRFVWMEMIIQTEWGGAPWLGGDPDTPTDGSRSWR